MSRSISYSEISSAQTCQARHAFGYTGHLTYGQTLHRRAIAPRLSHGRAWGAAVAAWHAFPADHTLMGCWQPVRAKMAAHGSLLASYAADIAEQAQSGVWVSPLLQVERQNWLAEVLDHYVATADRLPNLTRLEGEIDIPLPSRTGRRSSSLYRFQGFIDGFTVDDHDHEWIDEFKLRDSLTSVKQIELGRQIRWYAWAHQRASGRQVVGVIVDERLSKAPKPPRLVQARRKHEGIDGYVPSHAVDQLCLPEDYLTLCEEYGVSYHDETVLALQQRVWQQRVPIPFRPSELEEAGQELVSAAKLIRDLDSGDLFPVRNAQPALCNGCKFRDVCAEPNDELFVDTLFERTVPKRLRRSADSNGVHVQPVETADSPVPAVTTERDGPSHTPAPEPGTTDTPAPEQASIGELEGDEPSGGSMPPVEQPRHLGELAHAVAEVKRPGGYLSGDYHHERVPRL